MEQQRFSSKLYTSIGLSIIIIVNQLTGLITSMLFDSPRLKRSIFVLFRLMNCSFGLLLLFFVDVLVWLVSVVLAREYVDKTW